LEITVSINFINTEVSEDTFLLSNEGLEFLKKGEFFFSSCSLVVEVLLEGVAQSNGVVKSILISLSLGFSRG